MEFTKVLVATSILSGIDELKSIKVDSFYFRIRVTEENSDPLGRWEIHVIESSSGEEESPSPSEWTKDAEAEEWAVDESVFIGKEGEVGKQGSQRIGEIEVVGESVQVNDADATQKDKLPVVQESRQRDFEKSPCSKVMSASNDEGSVEAPSISVNTISGPVDAKAALLNDGVESRFEAQKNRSDVFYSLDQGDGISNLPSALASDRMVHVEGNYQSENGKGRTESHVEGGRSWQDGERKEENETGMLL
ncbi:hypothetical protein L6452_01161 [Arctium lappa]|uniref:Uncharacterized protein n=1 Tax=Arctium lappa TaxID=4217 RepID=A0ACB9FGS7_ARCLA|nr:hypothetical protein L6452_01161 [Arctium lappa]